MFTAKISRNLIKMTLLLLAFSFFVATSSAKKAEQTDIDKMFARLNWLMKTEKTYSSVWELYIGGPVNNPKNKYYRLLQKMWQAAPQDIESLRRAFENKKLGKETRVVAAILLAVNGDKKTIPAMIANLSDYAMSYGMSVALQIHTAPEVTTKLNELVFDKKSKISPFYLVEALARRRETEALKGLEESLKQQRFGGHEACEAINGIRSHGKTGLPILIKLFQTLKYERYLIANALAEYPSWEAQQHIVKELGINKKGNFENNDNEASRYAIRYLSHVNAIETLESILKSNVDNWTRSIAAAALGNINDKKAFHLLLEAITNKETQIAEHAAKALGKTAYKKGVGSLIRTGRARFRSLPQNVLEHMLESALRLDRKRLASAVLFFRKSQNADDLAYADLIERHIGKDRLEGKIPKKTLDKIKSGLRSIDGTALEAAIRETARWRTSKTAKLLLNFLKGNEPLLIQRHYGYWYKALKHLATHDYAPGNKYIKQVLAKMLPFHRYEFKHELASFAY